MKKTFFLLPLLFLSCSGEDRAGEQPFAPTVTTVSATVNGNAVTLVGRVNSSVNSRLTAVGFKYTLGKETKTVKVEPVTENFVATVDTLSSGSYSVTAYATNGIGTTEGEKLTFVIP